MHLQLLQQLQKWHDNDEHKKIITAILEIPTTDLTPELIGLLARAYNNNDEYEKAIKQLLSIKEQGKNDALWWFRLGYAYYYLNKPQEALEAFEKCKTINPKEKDINYFINSLKTEYLAFEEEKEIPNPSSKDENYTTIIKHEDTVTVCFYIDTTKVFNIGEKMNALHKNAYMNGYNWEAFFNYYLPIYDNDILTGMNSDPEAGMYTAYYDLTPENEERAKKLEACIRFLIEHEKELYRIIHEEGNKIAWD